MIDDSLSSEGVKAWIIVMYGSTDNYRIP